ncbi:SDR family oxidoreductase [Diaminobutyricibacter tongyongensis]|uniref:SDR family oxidoreductase n=1 Tax=Leifsonia tongyongensis TaxID=1268043 RepID=A0A6L9XWJ6_9MICO|nr:SDR family oxidoreductase [Diaminobutyricibacter tongyongensis]NEN05789.1 SDR family oxidoreductase [Diaminobutyricibacter tongyongensis]
MLLDGRNAIIWGGGGAIGGAVARAFAREGARVHLCGRTQTALDAVADDIRASGGLAETAVVDALDEAQVTAHVQQVARDFGSVDVAFDLISVGDVQGTPMVEMALADYEQPIVTAVRSFFITSKAVARPMMAQGRGVILTFGGDGGRDPIRHYSIGGFQVALQAVDAMRRQLAAELGEHGIRVATIHTGGVLETLPRDFPGREVIAEMIVGPTMLGRAATLGDVGDVAVFLASDKAATITAAAINITAGAVAD